MIQVARNLIALTLFCGWVLIATQGRVARGEDPLTMPQQFEHIVKLVQYEAAGGRLISFPQRIGHRTNQIVEQNGIRHELQVDSRAPASSVVYVVTAPHFEVRITTDNGDHYLIQRTSTGDAPEGVEPVVPLTFEQYQGKPISLTVEYGGEPQSFAVSSIWHLMLAAPQAFREELVPLLELLRPDWNLIAISDEIENTLMHQARISRVNQQMHWSTLVQGLADDRFAVREAADRHLREAGPAVLPLLRRLDPEHLDAEQRFRIRRIINHLSAAESVDTADTVVAWLASDPATWLSLLERDDESLRNIAAEQLRLLLGREIDFDPAAEEAIRAKQVQRLRNSIPGL